MFESYKNKTVLVTGHTGFKGSWLSIWLLRLGAKVVGYSLAPKNINDNYELSDLKNKVKDYISDIRDFKRLNQVIEQEKPDIIFHFAAQPLVLNAYENPKYTIETNTLGTCNIIYPHDFCHI